MSEMAMLRQESVRLEVGIQRYIGESMGSLQYEELTKLEHDLEMSVTKVRNRKVKTYIAIMCGCVSYILLKGYICRWDSRDIE